jgi:hypothetical protein
MLHKYLLPCLLPLLIRGLPPLMIHCLLPMMLHCLLQPLLLTGCLLLGPLLLLIH